MAAITLTPRNVLNTYLSACILQLDMAQLMLQDVLSDVGAHGNPLPSRAVRIDSPSPMNPFNSISCLYSKDSMDESLRRQDSAGTPKSTSSKCVRGYTGYVCNCLSLSCLRVCLSVILSLSLCLLSAPTSPIFRHCLQTRYGSKGAKTTNSKPSPSSQIPEATEHSRHDCFVEVSGCER